MPRAMPKWHLAEFYAGLESIKNGCAYDKRYSFKKQRFNRPQILVFSNQMPYFKMLTQDRRMRHPDLAFSLLTHIALWGLRPATPAQA